MILPAKHLLPGRSLSGIGAWILKILRDPMTVSALWERVRKGRETRSGAPITYRWFVLALDLLYMIGAVELVGGVLRRRNS